MIDWLMWRKFQTCAVAVTTSSPLWGMIDRLMWRKFQTCAVVRPGRSGSVLVFPAFGDQRLGQGYAFVFVQVYKKLVGGLVSCSLFLATCSRMLFFESYRDRCIIP
jgi:hypothetical protein